MTQQSFNQGDERQRIARISGAIYRRGNSFTGANAILLLLSGNPHTWFNSATVYEVVKSNRSSVSQWLERLAERKILACEVRGAEAYYKFSPVDESIWKQVTELRDTYKKNR